MNYSDEQFEIILDEGLELLRAGKSVEEIIAMFPNFADELADILSVVEHTHSFADDMHARESLHAVINKVSTPELPTKKLFAMTFKYPVLIGAFAIVILAVVVGDQKSMPENFKSNTVSDASLSYTSQAGMARPELAIFNPAKKTTPITDTREFIKTTYSATIRTRDAQEIATRAQTIIRGHGGRIDSFNSYEDHGYISFVISKSDFNAFTAELKSIVGERFIIEQESGENLLPQKRTIENETKSNQNQLEIEKKNLAELEVRHNTAKNSFDQQIAAVNKIISTADPSEHTSLLFYKTTVEKKRALENSNYFLQRANIVASVDQSNAELKQLGDQDQNLSDTVATISGSLTIEKITWYDVITTYVPGWILLSVTAIVAWYFIKIRRASR